MATLVLECLAGTDDAENVGGVGYSDSTTYIFVGGTGGFTTDAGEGWRFPGCTLTSADTVTSVKISFEKNDNGWAYQADRWVFQDSDDAQAFDSSNAPGASTRPITSVIVYDDHNTNHLADTVYDLPQDTTHQDDLAASLQEVLARGGWSSGNAVCLLDNTSQDASFLSDYSRKQWKAYDAGAFPPTLTITYTPGGPTVQYARPDSDVSRGSWTTDSGATANLWDSINETPANDSDYVRSSQSPGSADILTLTLTDVGDPASSTGHKVRYRYGKDLSSGDRIDLTVRLMQGTTQIAAWTHTNIGTTLTDAEQTLSSGEADAITDYNDLRLKFEAVKV